MAKKKSASIIFTCSSCGNIQPRWLGRCPECGEWNSFIETYEENNTSIFAPGKGTSPQRAKPVLLSSVTTQDGPRFCIGIQEFDRVLGGGAMKRSVVLIGGEPGIGKSTLLIQACAAAGESKTLSNGNILYVSGEESAAQIKSRADRLKLNTNRIEILCTTRLEDIEDALNKINPVFIVIDSIQTVFSPEAGIVPGTVNQLKYCGNELISWVKERDSVMFLTAHITKEGTIAGPKSLEHMVDTVITFERNDEDVRFIRAQKNRFGSTDELGIFSMDENGLHTLDDTSSLFIVRRAGEIPAGIAVVPVFEGSRAFLVEIQALTVPAKASISRVYSDKIDSARISRIAAVLEKRAGLRFSDQDIYINVAGGIRLTESAIDIAIAAALYSARTDIPLEPGIALVGELSLAGEIRPVNRLKQRAKTSFALGFLHFLAPRSDGDECMNMNITSITNIKMLVKVLFSK